MEKLTRLSGLLEEDEVRTVEEWEGVRAHRGPAAATMSARHLGRPWQAELKRFVDSVDYFLGEEIRNRAVLELGCGPGLITKRLAARAARVTAVDISATLLAENKALLGERAANVRYVETLAWRYEPEPHDAAICARILTHCEPARLPEAASVLTRSAPAIYVFEHTIQTGPVSAHTFVRSEAELIAAFSGYTVARRVRYWHFEDGYSFLKLIRAA